MQINKICSRIGPNERTLFGGLDAWSWVDIDDDTQRGKANALGLTKGSGLLGPFLELVCSGKSAEMNSVSALGRIGAAAARRKTREQMKQYCTSQGRARKDEEMKKYKYLRR
jgi:hypothetical protein